MFALEGAVESPCVCVYPSELLLHTQGCLYIVCIIMYMCVISVYVYLSELLLEFSTLGFVFPE